MGLSYVGRLAIRQTSRQYRREGERKHQQVGASRSSSSLHFHIALHHGQRAGQTDQRQDKTSKQLHDRDEGMGQRAGVQDARSIEYGSFPLASWLCRMPSPRLHFLAGLAAGDP